MTNKLVVDLEKCQGHGRCYLLAPELFDLDENGIAVVLAPDVTPDQLEKAELAISNCPEVAIALI